MFTCGMKVEHCSEAMLGHIERIVPAKAGYPEYVLVLWDTLEGEEYSVYRWYKLSEAEQTLFVA